MLKKTHEMPGKEKVLPVIALLSMLPPKLLSTLSTLPKEAVEAIAKVAGIHNMESSGAREYLLAAGRIAALLAITNGAIIIEHGPAGAQPVVPLAPGVPTNYVPDLKNDLFEDAEALVEFRQIAAELKGLIRGAQTTIDRLDTIKASQINNRLIQLKSAATRFIADINLIINDVNGGINTAKGSPVAYKGYFEKALARVEARLNPLEEAFAAHMLRLGCRLTEDTKPKLALGLEYGRVNAKGEDSGDAEDKWREAPTQRKTYGCDGDKALAIAQAANQLAFSFVDAAHKAHCDKAIAPDNLQPTGVNPDTPRSYTPAAAGKDAAEGKDTARGGRIEEASICAKPELIPHGFVKIEPTRKAATETSLTIPGKFLRGLKDSTEIFIRRGKGDEKAIALPASNENQVVAKLANGNTITIPVADMLKGDASRVAVLVPNGKWSPQKANDDGILGGSQTAGHVIDAKGVLQVFGGSDGNATIGGTKALATVEVELGQTGNLAVGLQGGAGVILYGMTDGRATRETGRGIQGGVIGRVGAPLSLNNGEGYPDLTLTPAFEGGAGGLALSVEPCLRGEIAGLRSAVCLTFGKRWNTPGPREERLAQPLPENRDPWVFGGGIEIGTDNKSGEKKP